MIKHECSYLYMWSFPQEPHSCPAQTPPPEERAPLQEAVTKLPAACSDQLDTQELHLSREEEGKKKGKQITTLNTFTTLNMLATKPEWSPCEHAIHLSPYRTNLWELKNQR